MIKCPGCKADIHDEDCVISSTEPYEESCPICKTPLDFAPPEEEPLPPCDPPGQELPLVHPSEAYPQLRRHIERPDWQESVLVAASEDSSGLVAATALLAQKAAKPEGDLPEELLRTVRQLCDNYGRSTVLLAVAAETACWFGAESAPNDCIAAGALATIALAQHESQEW